MDRRFLLAIVLTIGVIVLSNYLFPPPRPAPSPTGADSSATARSAPGSAVAAASPTGSTPVAARAAPAGSAPHVGAPAVGVPVPARAESVTVQTSHATMVLTSLGAAPVEVTLPEYRRLVARRGGQEAAAIRTPGLPLLRYAVLAAGDTVRFDAVPFTVTRGVQGGQQTVGFRGVERGITLNVRYVFDSAEARAFRAQTRVSVDGAPANAFLRVDLPRGFESQEAKPEEDATHLSYAFKPVKRAASSIAFSKPDPGELKLESGPFTWLAAKNKYFVVGLVSDSLRTPFEELHVTGQERVGKQATAAQAEVYATLARGAVEFDLYAGPQAWERLRAVGREFENVNPYGGWLQGAVQPFATIVMRVLLWMKRSTGLSYGWILIVFAVAVRVILWPMNQSAMRSSLKMQRLQPELQATQEKYKGDPQQLQQEMMKVYKAHDMSPLSPLMGCLPLLIPMPILFALFFVFQNTIEFRGVSFLWLPDISLADPFYVFPVLMAASMYLLSWLGMRNSPPNPQAKMMSWLLPGMMLVMFLNFASGLTLYYFVQNLAALPQQWLIANERSKAAAPG
ncbi:MAG: membrane protein insertase YidC [Gemmatimonadetes bacterium]|nr:membrane protein insertase YidC [Gemmatimonadota bacterium]